MNELIDENKKMENAINLMNDMLIKIGEENGNSAIVLQTKISKFEHLTRAVCLDSDKLLDHDDRFLPVINLIDQAEEMYNDIISQI